MQTDTEVYKQECIKTAKHMLEMPWHQEGSYANWLAQSHFYVKHSTPLLLLAGALVAKDDYELHNRFIVHASEEKGHSELLISDLFKLGHKIEDFEVHPSTAAFYQSQYYWISNRSPKAFFGYILFLECLAVNLCDSMADKISPIYGKGSVRFLRVHGAEDPDHVDHAFEQIQRFSKEEQRLVKENFFQSKAHYMAMLEHCGSERVIPKNEGMPMTA